VAELNRNDRVIKSRDGRFSIQDCKLDFKREVHSFLLDQLDLFMSLHQKGEFILDGDRLFYRIDEIIVSLTTAEEIFIINEIFLARCYSFSAKGNFCAIDIGMNAGFASLFLANHKNINSVYSFEPFPETFNQAISNLKLNKEVSSKIKPFNFGLSDSNQNLTTDYNYVHKGQVGVWGTDLIIGNVGKSQKVNIELRSATEVLTRIVAAHPGEKFILKMDCEGAEYAIFSDLAKSNILESIDLVIIEWHERGPNEILEILLKYNFKSLFHQLTQKKVGMIYATK
jgi:FkbM family methyltransferase